MSESDALPRPFETLSRETRFTCPYWHLFHDRYRLPSGDVADYHFVHTGGSTMVVPVLPDGRLILVRQFRYLVQRWSEEFPCGGVSRGVDVDENALKELREEAGLRPRNLERIGGFAPFNGVSDEICHVYLARGFEEMGAEPEATEFITVVRRTVEEVETAIESGEIWDGMTIASFTIAKNRI